MLYILPQSLKHTLKRFSQILLPSSCLLCGADSDTRLLCAACYADLPLAPQPHCPQCGDRTTHGERRGACLTDPPAFTRTFAIFSYEFPVDRIIHAFKYGHQLAIADWASEIFVQALAGEPYDLIIPLPLHPDRLRQRGFNQSAEIARRLGKKLRLPLDCHSLIRTRATAPQAELALKERTRNVRGAFECQRDLNGQRLLLIDDVMTTGATLREAARILKLHGAAQIDIAVIARALKH